MVERASLSGSNTINQDEWSISNAFLSCAGAEQGLPRTGFVLQCESHAFILPEMYVIYVCN